MSPDVQHFPSSYGLFYEYVMLISYIYVLLYVTFYMGFPGGSAGKESTCNPRDLGLMSGLGRSPGEGKGYRLQYSCLEKPMDCMVHGVAKSQTRLSEYTLILHIF